MTILERIGSIIRILARLFLLILLISSCSLSSGPPAGVSVSRYQECTQAQRSPVGDIGKWLVRLAAIGMLSNAATGVLFVSSLGIGSYSLLPLDLARGAALGAWRGNGWDKEEFAKCMMENDLGESTLDSEEVDE